MIEVTLSILALILLSLISACFSANISLLLFTGGGLMILIAAGYITDSRGKLMKILQLSFAVLFAVASENWWGCIVAALLLWMNIRQSLLLASAMYMMTASCRLFIIYKQTSGYGHTAGYLVASGILDLVFLEAACFVILMIRNLIKRMERNEEAERKRIQDFSLREMHEIQKNRELMIKSYFTEQNARLLERENISRNIHNSVGHSITAAIMTLDAADVLFDKDPEEAHKRMNEAAGRIRGSLTAIRSAVRALDEEGSDVSFRDLKCYFDNILDEFLMDTERTCERIYDIMSEEYSIPREHAEFLTGALSEFLTNGVKHGNASVFFVKLSGDKAHVRLSVMDNGTGDFSDDNREQRIREGFGLKKLTSYAERCGGRTEFTNDNGFRSVIELPLSMHDEV